MKYKCAVLVLSLLIAERLVSATLDQLLPWLSEPSLALGTSYSTFVETHPDAQNPLFPKRPKDGPFNGELFEGLGTDSSWIYTFARGELVSINWASAVNVEGTIKVVRDVLMRAHGQPVIETAARVDRRGSIARIVREVYRPTIDKDCVICLMATSEGVEVALTNEAIARKHGINTSRQTYEEAAKAISSVVQPSEKQSDLVDYLAAEREKAETPQPAANPKPPTLQPPTPSTPVAVAKAVESPAPLIERKAPVWPWLVGILAIIVVAAFELKSSRPN
jgi:hypothetical protein